MYLKQKQRQKKKTKKSKISKNLNLHPTVKTNDTVIRLQIIAPTPFSTLFFVCYVIANVHRWLELM